MVSTEKFQAEESYGDEKRGPSNFWADPARVTADLLRDLAGVHGNFGREELFGLVRQLLQTGEPLDDRKGTTELLIDILTKLPSGSHTRTALTKKFIDELWNNLQHPPLCYMGGDAKYEVVKPDGDSSASAVPQPAKDYIEFKAPDSDIILRERVPQSPDGIFNYRMPDGSYNNILQPNIGKAGTPYAKSVRNTKRLNGVKPDPGLLFDLLMARGDNDFKENPAGVSSMLFYHASIIIHDIFRTSRLDQNKSDTSSYLDLAPLYGSSLQDQLEIRTMKEGKLKPDTFHEKRLLGQPAGVNVMLVLYSRFHNYVCDILLKINENGRFTLACMPDANPEDKAKAVAKQDHDLFNTARLVTGGLYINICLHDYLRAITNTHHSHSDWTLDPRVDITKQYDGEGVPRGVGNQVSVEFNLLYRFHSCISKKDERWINKFFAKLFPNHSEDDIQNITLAELAKAQVIYEQKIPKDPSLRTFDGLERQADGKFKDEDLSRILKEAMDDPAGCFGSRMVPKALKIIEVLGIMQARKWQVASLNEFRDFFGLKRHESFDEINSDPEISKILEQLYSDPDMVELYPGLMIESIKPARNAGCGICPTYSVGRAILSDAVTLVRSDRFNTLDYTTTNLTNWGYNEVQQDYKTLGGSSLYKLIQRGLPGWFPYNSIAVMQPMYTKQANIKIATELGTIANYSLDDPKQPTQPVVLLTRTGIKEVLDNHKHFTAPWIFGLNALFPGKKDYSGFVSAEAKDSAQYASWHKALTDTPNLMGAVHDLVNKVGSQLIEDATFTFKEGLNQIDLIRDVAIPLNARLVADLFYLDLNSEENSDGKLGATELYRHLLNIRTWVLNNDDAAQSWNRRRRAQDSCQAIIASTKTLVNEVSHSHDLGRSIIKAVSGMLGRHSELQEGSLRSCGHKLVETMLSHKASVDDIVDNIWLTAFGSVGAPVTMFYEVMEFFLRKENESIWAEIQTFAQKGDSASIHNYVLEAQRWTSTQRHVRVANESAEIESNSIQPGHKVVLAVGELGRGSSNYESTTQFDHSLKTESVEFNYDHHERLAKDIALAFVTGLVQLSADLKALRPAPGEMGKVKTIQVGSQRAYLNDSWSYLCFDASTWKVHFDGHGKGKFTGDRNPTTLIPMQRYYYLAQKAKESFTK